MMRTSIVMAAVLASSGACNADRVSYPCDVCTGPGGRIPPDSLLLWRDTGLQVLTRPVFDDRAAYFFGIHHVVAVNKSTGTRLWDTPLTYPNGVPANSGYGTAMAAGRLIIGDVDVFGLDPASGAILWRFTPSTTFPGERAFDRLTTDGTTVYCGGVWGNVYGVDAATGTQRWVAHVTTLPDSDIRVFNPVLANGIVYVAFADHPPGVQEIDGGVAAIDAGNGRLLWSQYLRHHFGDHDTETESVAVTSTAVVTGSWDGFVYAFNPQTGAYVDSVSQTVFGFASGTMQATVFSFAVVDTVVVVGTQSGRLMALDARNLQHTLWSTAPTYAIMDLVADSTRAYAAFAGQQFTAINLADGKSVWWINASDHEYDGEDFLAAPALDGNRLYLGGALNIYAFKRR
jgi:outer membrane protein assembly factor BamB